MTTMNCLKTSNDDMTPEKTAKLAMLLMLNCDPTRTSDHLADPRHDPMAQIRERMTGKTLGIVGFDASGQELARRASHFPRMNVVIYDSSPIAPEMLARFNASQADTLDVLLPECDFVSVHCAIDPERKCMINSARLDLMKEDAFLINAADSRLVDPLALANALMFETIGGAAVGSFATAGHLGNILTGCDNLVVWPQNMDLLRDTSDEMIAPATKMGTFGVETAQIRVA